MSKLPPYIKTPLIYAIFGILWVFFTDRVLETNASNLAALTQMQTLKGCLYVIVTTALLYLLIARDTRRTLQQEQEKRDIFQATVKAAHHILHNFLNQMMLFKLEAEESDDFAEDVLELFDEVMAEAKTQIGKLSAITDLTKEQIEQTIVP